MLELIVILKENEIGNENSMLRYKIDNEDKNGHLGACKKFAHDYNLDIPNIEQLTSYDISIEFAKMGYVNIHVEGLNMLIYLPKMLSNEQYKWFKDNRNLLSKFSLSAASIGEDENVKHIENDEYEMRSVINKLYKEIKKKELLKKRLILLEKTDIKKL